jgi:hypothetical protein
VPLITSTWRRCATITPSFIELFENLTLEETQCYGSSLLLSQWRLRSQSRPTQWPKDIAAEDIMAADTKAAEADTLHMVMLADTLRHMADTAELTSECMSA